MTLPAALAGSLLFLAVIVPLVALYFLRLRRTQRVVSSSMPWRQQIEDLRANTFFQRLRASHLLLLQALLLLLLAIAVMQPMMRGWAFQPQRMVLLMDCSASMSTLDGEGGISRLAQAKRAAIARVEAMQGGGLFANSVPEVMVISFAQTAQVCAPFTSRSALLRSAIESIDITDERTLLQPALELSRAHKLTSADESTAVPLNTPLVIELFSDGKIADIAKVSLRTDESMVWTRIGEVDTANAGIAAAGCERANEDAAQVLAFAAIRNFGKAPASRMVTVRSAQNLLAASAAPLQLPSLTLRGVDQIPGERRIVFPEFSIAGRALMQFESSPHDAFRGDDQAFVALRATQSLRLAVVGSDPSLDSLLDALSPGSLQHFDRDTVEQLQTHDPLWADAFDAVVSVGKPPTRMTHGRWLHFGEIPQLPGLNPFGEAGRDFAQSVRGEYPALRQCNLNELIALRANRLAIQSNWQAVVEGAKSPLVIAGSTGAGFALLVTFVPGDSNWPFHRSFVNFTAQALDLLASMSDVASDESLEPGAMIRLRVPEIANNLTITPPGETAQPMQRRDGEASWGPARRAGAYRINWRDAKDQAAERWVAVNLMDEGECDIAAATQLPLSGESLQPSARDAAALDLWPWITVLAILLLLAEWWLYHHFIIAASPDETDST